MRVINNQLLTISNLLLFLIVLTSFLFPSPVSLPAQTEENSWPMAGANPERTSWVSEEVRGRLSPEWYRVIDPFINPKIQVIAADGKLFLSTARGLYAFDADNGYEVWVYPTELPLGHSPTYVNGILYVGGYDRRIHAIDASNGRLLTGWNFTEAEAGFETNPLVINGTVYAGNRDGYFYALDASNGNLKWKYKTDGPILFSAAYKDGVIYFASNDSHAYALDANDGSLVWKSAKLPGAGFHSFWPVIYKDYVLFSGSKNYRVCYERMDMDWELFTAMPEGELIGPTGTEPGDWVSGTVTIDAYRFVDYFEDKPWRRTFFILNSSNGQEVTFDADNDGTPDYAPVIWSGGVTHSGNKFPPVIGSDGVLYTDIAYIAPSSTGFPGYYPWSSVSGWKFGTKYISRVEGHGSGQSFDQPYAYSAGGNLIYWNWLSVGVGALDITIPYGSVDQWQRSWMFFSAFQDPCPIPGYDIKYVRLPAPSNLAVYGGNNGIYYPAEGPQNAPVPYSGRVYVQMYNCLIAFSSAGGATQLPMAEKVHVQNSPPPLSPDYLKQRLEDEIQRMLNAGHLRPGFHDSGSWSCHYGSVWNTHESDYLCDYFHNPADTLYALTRALPHLSPALQEQTRTYLQQEFTDYPPYDIAHIGWRDGAQREIFDWPPEYPTISWFNFGPRTQSIGRGFSAWTFPQNSFYGAWKYAQLFPGEAKNIFDEMKSKLETPPADSYLADYPYVHNAFIAGYIGYLELEKLAGYAESTSVRNELNRLLELRASTFTKDSPVTAYYGPSMNVARNFMFLVPELANYLHDNALSKVQQAVDEYHEIAPYWFVTKYDNQYGESSLDHLYNYNAMFQAKASILKETQEELTKYLDVPAFAVGDLFYIHNLISAIEAQSTTEPQPPLIGDLNNDGVVNILDLVIVGNSFGKSPGQTGYDSRADSNNSGGVIDIFDLILVGSNFGKSI